MINHIPPVDKRQPARHPLRLFASAPRPHLPPHRTALALTLSAQFSGGTGWNEPVRICRPGLLVSHIERLGHT